MIPGRWKIYTSPNHLLLIKIQEFLRPFFSEIKQQLLPWLLIDRNMSRDRVKINYHTMVPVAKG